MAEFLHHLSVVTERCIVTGKPAVRWSGHVVALVHGSDIGKRDFDRMRIIITAGFADDATKPEPDEFGCFGVWKPEYGMKLEESWQSEVSQ